MGDLREQLATAVPAVAHLLVFHSKGCQHPPYNELGLTDSFKKFSCDILAHSPIVDPRGRRIKIIENNFPKFLNLEPKKKGDPARPIVLVRMLKEGTLQEDAYKWELDRIEDLFWICDVLRTPDAIYPNIHRVVVADEVYVKVYDKLGSNVKLVFTRNIKATHETIVVTSYLTKPNRAIACVTGQPLWPRHK
jgi:hypothetical protein